MKIVGFNKKKKKRVTCEECAAIVEYVENEVKKATYTCMGDPSGHRYIDCPGCKKQIVIPGTSW